MGTSTVTLGETIWDLPPLILHPFNERVPPAALLENSRAALMLSGLIPEDGTEREELQRRLTAGRYAEIRMLFFLGKDVLRWIDQCLESAERSRELALAGIARQSFAELLTGSPPPCVKDKLIRWGVADYCSIFRRAIGLNALFASPPELHALAGEFLRNYHRYADGLYLCYLEAEPHLAIGCKNFRFELYASGEYSRMLESEWEGE